MRRTIFLLCLAGVLSLACLSPVVIKTLGAPVKISPAGGGLVSWMTPTGEGLVSWMTPTGEGLVSWMTPTGGGAAASETPAPGGFCACVTAAEALTLRDSPGIDGAPVGWLKAGDLVHLVSMPVGDWWNVSQGDRIGYVRSSYLVQVDCVEVEP